jgi:hypothetical protein
LWGIFDRILKNDLFDAPVILIPEIASLMHCLLWQWYERVGTGMYSFGGFLLTGISMG